MHGYANGPSPWVTTGSANHISRMPSSPGEKWQFVELDVLVVFLMAIMCIIATVVYFSDFHIPIQISQNIYGCDTAILSLESLKTWPAAEGCPTPWLTGGRWGSLLTCPWGLQIPRRTKKRAEQCVSWQKNICKLRTLSGARVFFRRERGRIHPHSQVLTKNWVSTTKTRDWHLCQLYLCPNSSLKRLKTTTKAPSQMAPYSIPT